MKKIILSLILMMSICTSAFAATLSPVPPCAVGTYNDFGQQIRLDINPKNTNAAKFKVYYAPGYNAAYGFKSFYVPATPTIQINYVWYVRTGFIAPSMGWWTIMVVSVGSDGRTSKPFITNVDVLR